MIKASLDIVSLVVENSSIPKEAGKEPLFLTYLSSEILSKIQDGKYILPKAEVCIDSIQKFDEQVVINKIEEVIIKTYYKFYGFTRL